MRTKLDIQWFIEQHRDWEKLLSEKPYCLNISRDVWNGRRLVCLKYSQIDSDFGLRIVRECRGIVLDEDTLEVVQYAFDKFGNVGESYVPTLDAKSMLSTVKIDGSIIKISKHGGKLLVSTNGTIDAYKAPVPEQIGCSFKSFGDIVEHVICRTFTGGMEGFAAEIDEGFTYIFELVSPWTRVVTPFHEPDMYLIGCRDLDPEHGYREVFFNDCRLKLFFQTPDILDFSSIDACLKYASSLDWTNEGFVVMDKDFNRVKVKNPSWLAVHHLCENHTMSHKRAIEIVRANEIDEVVGYFPEFKDALLEVKDRYNSTVERLEGAWAKFCAARENLVTRKDQALFITSQDCFGKFSGVGFCLLDGKVGSAREWFDKAPVEHIVKALGYKEKEP